MKKDTSKTLIGAFVIGAALLAVAGVVAVGSGRLFQRPSSYVMYFSGSVKGLRVGAPVQLKGVTMGQVTRINLVYNQGARTFLNQVVFEVPEGSIQIVGDPGAETGKKKRLTADSDIDGLIRRGLRAKLQMQSFVTGQWLVAFDFHPDAPLTLMGFEDDLPELPTLPSDMEALARSLDGLDYQAVIDSVINAASGIEKLATSPDLHEAVATAGDTLRAYRKLAISLDRHVGELSTAATAALADLRRLVNHADSRIDPMVAGISETAADLSTAIDSLDRGLRPVLENLDAAAIAARSALAHSERLLTHLSDLSHEDSALVVRFGETLRELRRAAATFQTLADYLARHPEALLKGKATEMEDGP